MNKSDYKLFGVLFLLIGLLFGGVFLFQKKGSTANVYYDGELVLTIDLAVDKAYEVEGALGVVKLLVKDHQIKVEEETSPRHLCSTQGFIKDAGDAIICLPNKIVVEITKENTYDTIVK